MKKACLIAAAAILSGLLVFRLSAGTPEAQTKGMIKLDSQVKKLLKEPRDGAKSNFDIPISVRIIGCTPDRKWYKARISYNFIGYFEYEGWVKVE